MGGLLASKRLIPGLAVLGCLLLPSAAAAAVPASCGGAADASFTPLKTVTGELPSSAEGSYVYVPFDVPAGATGIRVRYCHDQPEVPLGGLPLPNVPRHTLDLGLYGPRPAGSDVWGLEQFRGSGGSSIRDVTVAPNGFSDEATYAASRKGYVHGRTTRAFVPGPIGQGEWAVELGAAAIATLLEGDLDSKVAFRVQIDVTSSPDFADQPYVPTAYDPAPANPRPGWYAGDFHVHGEHEPGNAPMRETFRYAFDPIARVPAAEPASTSSPWSTTTTSTPTARSAASRATTRAG